MSGKRGAGAPAGGGGTAGLRGPVLLGLLWLACAVLVGRAVQLQVVEGETWAAIAESQHLTRAELPARRGAIYDRTGMPLALSQERYRISIAPGELVRPETTIPRLAEVLGLDDARLAPLHDPRRRWVVLPGRYTAQQRDRLGSLRGVYFERQLARYLPQADVGRELIGGVSGDGRALGGIEQHFDRHLRGTPGYSILRRDPHGAVRPSISLPVVPPVDGADVHLTLDFRLQEIADEALRQSIAASGASGGDLLITAPRSGEVLAAVSRRDGRPRSLAAFTEPFEPGSTLKPFVVAALLEEGRAEPEDSIFAEEGRWRTETGRLIQDVAAHGWLTLASALRVSSNVAIVKFAQRLSPDLQFRYLRDFGFGTPTGVSYPSEAAGRLARPARWSALTSASLAMGYEVLVTPIQLAMAYGALANGGYLMEPRLVREIRSPGGAIVEEGTEMRIRRVVSAETAARVTDALVAAVTDGTASRAALTTFEVAGKTGTARRLTASGYLPGHYTATFVGYFPATRPQLVILVKLDEPRDPYYGGLVAAPVTRETLHAALAVQGTVFDGEGLLAARRSASPAATRPRTGATGHARGQGRVTVFRTADGPPTALDGWIPESVPAPDLAGLDLREAARRAHALGLPVRVEGRGPVTSTRPAAGTVLVPGDTVTLVGADG